MSLTTLAGTAWIINNEPDLSTRVMKSVHFYFDSANPREATSIDIGYQMTSATVIDYYTNESWYESYYTTTGWTSDSARYIYFIDGSAIADSELIEWFENNAVQSTPLVTVSFNMMGHGTQIAAQLVAIGNTITEPSPVPTASGYAFWGWYEDSLCTLPFNFRTAITSNKTLYAKWTTFIQTYTLSFNTMGHGDSIPSQIVISGSRASAPNTPVATGYSFDGWYNESTYSTIFSFSTAITSDKTIYAKWTTSTQYTVTFNNNGHGTTPTSQVVYSGSLASKPSNPSASGYVFDDWYNDSSGLIVFDFDTPITSNKTLYARWLTTEISESKQIDWTKSMQQTYEFYKIDPATWKDEYRLTDVESCTINRDLTTDTLGSATFECTEIFEECYIRVYMIAKQGSIIEKVCLGTFLVQTPSTKFDGKRTSISMDGYTPLIELKNAYPAIGYSIRKWEEYPVAIMKQALDLCIEHMRAPVVPATVPNPIDNRNKLYANFIANPDDTWFSFISDYIAQANYQFLLEPEGRVLFNPITSITALQPVWIYNDDNSSILLPEVTDERDLYGVPNVVEVVYSTDTKTFIARVENNDPTSSVSIQNRGREVLYRDTNPGISDDMSSVNAQAYVEAYAEALLKKLSTLEHKVTYSHGYCPVRIGDGVILNYKAANLTNVKAEVISQSFDCTAGCTVEETAIYTTSLMGETIDIKHKINYVTLFGETPKTRVIGKNHTVIQADMNSISSEGRTWFGWFYDKSYTTEVLLGQTITENKTFYAKWTCIVSFNMMGHGSATTAQVITVGEAPIKPPNPTATGYTFKGWFKESTLTNEYKFDTPIWGDTTLFAKWA